MSYQEDGDVEGGTQTTLLTHSDGYEAQRPNIAMFIAMQAQGSTDQLGLFTGEATHCWSILSKISTEI